MDAGAVIGIILGILGVSGIVFTAMRYNRDDTTAVVQQQSTVLRDMAALNDARQREVDELRAERDNLRSQVAELRG